MRSDLAARWSDPTTALRRDLPINSESGGPRPRRRLSASRIASATSRWGGAAGGCRELFAAEISDGIHTKDVSPDGSKFLLVLKSRDKPPPVRLTVVTDWSAQVGK